MGVFRIVVGWFNSVAISIYLLMLSCINLYCLFEIAGLLFGLLIVGVYCLFADFVC